MLLLQLPYAAMGSCYTRPFTKKMLLAQLHQQKVFKVPKGPRLRVAKLRRCAAKRCTCHRSRRECPLVETIGGEDLGLAGLKLTAWAYTALYRLRMQIEKTFELQISTAKVIFGIEVKQLSWSIGSTNCV